MKLGKRGTLEASHVTQEMQYWGAFEALCVALPWRFLCCAKYIEMRHVGCGVRAFALGPENLRSACVVCAVGSETELPGVCVCTCAYVYARVCVCVCVVTSFCAKET